MLAITLCSSLLLSSSNFLNHSVAAKCVSQQMWHSFFLSLFFSLLCFCLDRSLILSCERRKVHLIILSFSIIDFYGRLCCCCCFLLAQRKSLISGINSRVSIELHWVECVFLLEEWMIYYHRSKHLSTPVVTLSKKRSFFGKLHVLFCSIVSHCLRAFLVREKERERGKYRYRHWWLIRIDLFSSRFIFCVKSQRLFFN